MDKKRADALRTLLARTLRVGLLLGFIVIGVVLGLDVRRSEGVDTLGGYLIVGGVGSSLFLLALVVRAKVQAHRFGEVEANSGWSGTRTALLGTTAFCSVVAALLGLLAARSSAHPSEEIGSAICFLNLGLFHVTRLWPGVQFRRGGIVAEFSAINWRSVRAYEWGGKGNNSLVLRIRPSIAFLWGNKVMLPLSEEEHGAVNSVLSAHLGAPLNARNDPYHW